MLIRVFVYVVSDPVFALYTKQLNSCQMEAKFFVQFYYLRINLEQKLFYYLYHICMLGLILKFSFGFYVGYALNILLVRTDEW